MQEPGLSRREFLQKATAGAAGLAAGAVFDVGHAHATEAESNLEQWSQLQERLQQQITEGYQVQEWKQFDDRAKNNAKYYYSLRENSSVSKVDAVRNSTLQIIGRETLQRYIELAWKSKKLPEAFRTLYELDCHGLVLASLAKRGLYGDNRFLFDESYWDEVRIAEAVFAARASDYLPDSTNINDEEIDMRIKVASVTTSSDPFVLDQHPNKPVVEDLRDLPGWSLPERQIAFRQVLDHPTVRELLQNSTCTLAEAYSTIKTALLETGYQMTEQTPDLVRQLLEARQRFIETVFLSRNTETYIGVTYTEADENEGTVSLEGEVTTEVYRGSLKSKTTEGKWLKIDSRGQWWAETLARDCRVLPEAEHYFNSEDEPAEVLRTIAASTGDTCLFINAHGRMNGDIRLNSKKDGVMSSADVAEALVKRLHRTKDPATLGQVKIILNSCSSADFVFRLRFELYRAYRERPLRSHSQLIPVEQITLPTALAVSQLGNVAFDNMLYDPYWRTMRVIGDEQRLTGEQLMRRIQPMAYPFGDLAFFTDTHGQAPYMMGETSTVTGSSKTQSV